MKIKAPAAPIMSYNLTVLLYFYNIGDCLFTDGTLVFVHFDIAAAAANCVSARQKFNIYFRINYNINLKLKYIYIYIKEK